MRFLKQTNGTYVAYMTNGMTVLTPNKHDSSRFDILIKEEERVVYLHPNAPSLNAAMFIAGGKRCKQMRQADSDVFKRYGVNVGVSDFLEV